MRESKDACVRGKAKHDAQGSRLSKERRKLGQVKIEKSRSGLLEDMELNKEMRQVRVTERAWEERKIEPVNQKSQEKGGGIEAKW